VKLLGNNLKLICSRTWLVFSVFWIPGCQIKYPIHVFLDRHRKNVPLSLHMLCNSVHKFLYLASYPVRSLLLNLSEKSIPFPSKVFPLNLLNASLALIWRRSMVSVSSYNREKGCPLINFTNAIYNRNFLKCTVTVHCWYQALQFMTTQSSSSSNTMETKYPNCFEFWQFSHCLLNIQCLLKCWKPQDQLHNDKKTKVQEMTTSRLSVLTAYEMVSTALTYIQFYLCYNVLKLILLICY